MTVRPAMLALLFLTCAVALSGWTPAVVASGSMSPAVRAGDVVILSPPARDRLAPGHVISFEKPGRPGRPVLHRIIRVTGNGQLITQGDANPVPDPTPVSPASVTGSARLRVPYAGLPVLWWLERG